MVKKVKNIIDNIIFFLLRFFPVKRSGVKKLCIFRKDGLGDVILFLPSYHSLRKYYSDYRIYCVAPKSAVNILKKQNTADEIISFETNRFRNNLIYRFKMFLRLYREGFDIVIYPVHRKEKFVIKFLDILKSTEKVCTDGPIFNNEKYVVKNKDTFKFINITKDTELDKNSEFVNKLCGVNNESLPRIHIDDKWKLKASSILRENNLEKFVLVMPFSGQEYKNWPIERFEEIIIYLKDIYSLRSVIIGLPSDKSVIDNIVHNLKEYDCVGISNVDTGTLCALAQKSSFYLGNDTGLLHISAAVGVKNIGIMGNEFGRSFFPYGDKKVNIAIESPNINPKDLHSGGEVEKNILSISTDLVKKTIDNLINEEDN